MQTLDQDQNPQNGIVIDSKNITLSLIINGNTSETTLQDIINQYDSSRTLVSTNCALVHLEEVLKDDGFYVDTVPPCKPKLEIDINATSNDYTYIELIGERYSKIFLNGVDTNKSLDKAGRHYEFEPLTPIRRGTFDDFNITLVDDTNKVSDILKLHILNDSDQPNFIEPFPANNSITIQAPATFVYALNVSDDSVIIGQLKLKYELSGADSNLFTIDSNGKVEFNDPSIAGSYQITVKVIDAANHYDTVDLNITVNN